MHPSISPALPPIQTHHSCSQPADHSSVPAQEHYSDGDPLTLQGSAKLPSSQTHHGGKRQQAAERTTRANFKKKLLDKRRIHCFSVLPASEPQHKCCCTSDAQDLGKDQDLRKGQQEQLAFGLGHTTCASTYLGTLGALSIVHQYR